MKGLRFQAGATVPAFSLCLLLAAYALAADAPRKPATVKTPLGLLPLVWPADNPYSPEKVELGRYLYFDPRLSADGSVSCASCHSPKYAFTDGAPVTTGMRGQKVTPWLGGTRAASFWRWPGTLQPADIGALTAHVDFFPTIAELAGAKLTEEVRAQVEGRSLVPLLKNANAAWPDRKLFTHVGRWEHGKAAQAKYHNCSVRNTRWQLVCISPEGEKRWQLFDIKADPAEKDDVASQHPEIVSELDTAYSAWWDSVQPQLVNEDAVGPKVNPFKELYWRQFGGGPDQKEGSVKKVP